MIALRIRRLQPAISCSAFSPDRNSWLRLKQIASAKRLALSLAQPLLDRLPQVAQVDPPEQGDGLLDLAEGEG
jgi:hypothetical protein